MLFRSQRGLGLDGRKEVNGVAALGSPRNVVQVAEGIDVQDVDEGGGEDEVLDEGVEHVARVEVEERGKEVDTEGRDHGSDERADGDLEERAEDLLGSGLRSESAGDVLFYCLSMLLLFGKMMNPQQRSGQSTRGSTRASKERGWQRC